MAVAEDDRDEDPAAPRAAAEDRRGKRRRSRTASGDADGKHRQPRFFARSLSGPSLSGPIRDSARQPLIDRRSSGDSMFRPSRWNSGGSRNLSSGGSESSLGSDRPARMVSQRLRQSMMKSLVLPLEKVNEGYTFKFVEGENAPRGGETPGHTLRQGHFRLLDRNPLQGHSVSKLRIHRIHDIFFSYRLFLKDLFHTLVNLHMKWILVLFICMYLFAFSTLAWLFWLVGKRCDLELASPLEAFALSVETWLTIGYGVPDPYFRQCFEGVALVTAQGIIGLVMNAMLVGIVITHISSGARRGCTVIFADKAVIRQIEGGLYFMVQVCEMRHTQLLEAHVRLYMIRNPVDSSETPFLGPQAFEMRLLRPDDDRGSLLLPVIPSAIVHEIDGFSPLVPPTRGDPMCVRHWSRPLLRASDAEQGARDSVWCKTCGESFNTAEMLAAHVRYQAEQDALNKTTKHPHVVPEDEPAGHRMRHRRSCDVDTEEWRRTVMDFLEDEWFEIVCVLEGVDTTTAATVQARRSYTMDDIVWDHTFAPCFALDPSEGACIDFTKINDLVEAPPE